MNTEIVTKQLICIVDDDLVNVEILSSVLGSEYRICKANCGLEAIEVIERELPDLVLMDVMMPDIDGFEVCEIIKEKVETADIPVIFLTGLEEQGDQEKGFDLGAMDFISKPIQPKVVKIRVGRVLQLSLYVQFLEGLLAEKSQSVDVLQERVRDILGEKDGMLAA